jgi:glycosyltransferase involved in cell wall biosynthesis
MNQTWQNIEIILVDDGSKDATLEIAKRYESKYLKVIHQENQGQSASENRALREAQGEFIQYLDADDLLAPDKIARQMQLFEDGHSESVVACEWSRFYNALDEAMFIPQLLWADFEPIDWLLCAWENHLMMHGAAWLIPRPIANRAGWWSEELSLINDFDYFSRVLLASQGIKFCWGAKTYYRSGNTGSLSGSKSYSAWKSAFRSLELGTGNLLTVENSERTRHGCATVFQRFIYEVYPEAPDLVEAAAAKVQQWGGSDVQPSGGPAFQLLTNILGWQKAKQLQGWAYQYGYGKTALGWKISNLKKKLMYREFSKVSKKNSQIINSSSSQLGAGD